ncbi:MAG: hypothetical protein Q7V05_16675 [Methanoregula sp.]|nr:hypothetical protein [Methanoregula sp.]
MSCTMDANPLRFVYHDNGAGMPAGSNWKNTESLGLRLVRNAHNLKKRLKDPRWLDRIPLKKTGGTTSMAAQKIWFS